MRWLALATLLSAAPASSTEADISQIRALTTEFVKGFNEGDLDRIMSFYADDYVDVNLRQPRQTRAERRAYFQRIVDPGGLRVEVTPDEIVINGDYAYVRGTILLTRSKPDGNAVRELRYMEVAHRLPEGWKAVWGIDAEIYPDSP